jgi:hypothetical protein
MLSQIARCDGPACKNDPEDLCSKPTEALGRIIGSDATMTYDPETVLARYQNLLDIAEGEPTESCCALMSPSGDAPDALGCEPQACRNCCVGVVEMVRQFSERAATLETQSIEILDIHTKAKNLARE